MIFDAHLDLSLNALEYNRDLRSSISEIRELEAGMSDLNGRAHNTVNFSAMREADIGICGIDKDPKYLMFFKKGKTVGKIKQEKALEKILDEVDKFGKN